jgi:hypothetical protein
MSLAIYLLLLYIPCKISLGVISPKNCIRLHQKETMSTDVFMRFLCRKVGGYNKTKIIMQLYHDFVTILVIGILSHYKWSNTNFNFSYNCIQFQTWQKICIRKSPSSFKVSTFMWDV